MGELCRLRPGDVVYQDRRVYLRVEGKGLRERLVPLPPILARRIERHLRGRSAETRSERLLLSLRRSAAGDFEPLTESGVLQLVHSAADRAGLRKRVHPHGLRHSWMTEMLRRGMNPLQLSRIAGASLQVIQEHYEHLTHDDAYDAMLSALTDARDRRQGRFGHP